MLGVQGLRFSVEGLGFGRGGDPHRMSKRMPLTVDNDCTTLQQKQKMTCAEVGVCEDRIGTGPPRARTEVIYVDLGC